MKWLMVLPLVGGLITGGYGLYLKYRSDLSIATYEALEEKYEQLQENYKKSVDDFIKTLDDNQHTIDRKDAQIAEINETLNQQKQRAEANRVLYIQAQSRIDNLANEQKTQEWASDIYPVSLDAK